MKKVLVAFTLVIVLLAASLVGCDIASTGDGLAAEKANAAAVFTLDVNPGVRIYVREDDTVIAVEATNEDGEEVVKELVLEGVNYEEVVEDIVDKMEEKGYLKGEESSVLISVEKKMIEISEKVNEKINKAFEKHGKKASVIEQELDELEEKVEEEIGKIAKKYNISEGKAHLIEKIREEFPELSEEELASLKVNDLGIMLEETSDELKEHFKKVGKAVKDAYVGKEEALNTALESLEITPNDVTMPHVRITRDDGKMLYEVEFVYDGMEYEITVDAKSGEILETESEEYEEFDPESFIDDFCNKHEIDIEGFKDHIMNGIFGKDEHKDEHKDEESQNKPLNRGEILKSVLAELAISEKSLKKTDVELHRTENGAIFSVTVETVEGDVYTLVVEAFSGAILEAELNGSVIETEEKAAE